MTEHERLDTTVTVHGTALDDHAGAVVVRDGARDVYVTGLVRWPPEAYGLAVEVTGILRSRRLGPEPTVDDQGMVTHGIAGGGEVLFLDDARWDVVD